MGGSMSRGTVIARGGVALRKSPKTGAVRKTLRRNSQVEILEQETWLRVRTSDGSEGFVLADFIESSPADLFPAAASPAPGAAAAAARAPTVLNIPAPSAVCDIRIYRNTQFIGNELRADFDFFPSLDRVHGLARDCAVELFVTSSTREPGRTPRGAIVPPASKSNHLVGHAIDVNVRSNSGFFNSQALRRANLANLPPEIRRFVELVRNDDELRWGGDFTPEDPVHIDDGLNRTDPARWDSKLASRG